MLLFGLINKENADKSKFTYNSRGMTFDGANITRALIMTLLEML